MPDISMCKGGKCPQKKDCYRHNAKPSEFRQSFFVTPPYNWETKSCTEFWEDEYKKEKG